jgi:hypothetical protein
MTRIQTTSAQLCILLLLASNLEAETLNLSADFVRRVKNRATLFVQFEIDEHLKSPHRVGKSGDDGDIHMAGRAPEVELPMVVEVMNAGLGPQADTVRLLDNTPSGQTVAVTGVWRIWFEHPSPGDQTQGDPVEAPANSNPDHVFEIHPVTLFGSNDIADSSLVPILAPGDGHPYDAYPANVAFPAYEKLKATVTVSDTAVSITSNKAGYNYAEFVLEPAGKPAHGDNGIFVLANVYDVSDPENPITSEPRRMVFVENTEPAKELQKLPQGERMHVLGIPRVDLAQVAAVTNGETVNIALPYEMIIVAVFPDVASESEAKPKPATPKNGRGQRGTKR